LFIFAFEGAKVKINIKEAIPAFLVRSKNLKEKRLE